MNWCRPTELVIDRSAIAHNVGVYLSRLKEGTRLMAVVKADGYGHGLVEVARTAVKRGAHHLGVATVEEGALLRENGISAPILVLGGTSACGVAEAILKDIALTIHDMHSFHMVKAQAESLGAAANAHLKLDSGMSRIGFQKTELSGILQLWKASPSVHMQGAFTHFATADEDEALFKLQLDRFHDMIRVVREFGFSPMLHAANSAAALRFPQAHFDMVRVGVGLYGAAVLPFCPELRPAQRLVTQPTQVKWIEAGAFVGYGATYRAKSPMRIMTLPIGYGDGYFRALSNKACALVEGKRAPLVGRVCMDQIMVDVTDIPEAGLSSEAVLLGGQKGDAITADEIAGWADTIAYEIMLSFGPRVPKVYVGG